MRWSVFLKLSGAMVAVLLVFATSLNAAYPQTITTPVPFVNLPRPSDDPRWSEAFSHWDKRDVEKEAFEAVRVFEAIAKDKPNKFRQRLSMLEA